MDQSAFNCPDVVVLSATDRAILQVLTESLGRVVSRDSLLRLAGIDNVSARRADASLVVLRKVLGAENVITVRRRGWMLSDEAHKAAVNLLTREIELRP
jgi:DNA-binding winged helix-turn-helix (wHTH) protein